jgi:hypothetical protein
MKKLVLTLAISVMATTAYAGGGKAPILHCGVGLGDANMTYKAISVSKNSKGHGKNHVIGSTDSVATGVFDGEEEIYVDYLRAGDDCLLEGEAGDLGIAALCEGATQYDGAICGMEVM